MKKHCFGFVAILFGFIALFTSTVKTQAETLEPAVSVDSEVQALFSKYYGEGVYTKDTVINVDLEKMQEDLKNLSAVVNVNFLFHYFGDDLNNQLTRTTYYKVDELWMTNKSGSINSGYGTSQEGMTHFSIDQEGNKVVDYTVSGTTMEDFYVTLYDIKEDSGWVVENGVYTNKNPEVIDNFRLFTAPLWLNTNDSIQNYVTYTHATVEEKECTLILKLYASSTNSGLLTSNELVFSQAIISGSVSHIEEIIPTVNPTCTEVGWTEGKKCSVCDKILVAQEEIPMTTHTEVKDAAVDPTCTETGLTEGKHCSVCGTVTKAQETIDALGHTEVKDDAVAATCTETGLTEGKHCSVCNTTLVPQEVVDALGHTEVVDNAIAPTCTTAGKTLGKHCSVCNAVIVAQTSVDALGHTEVVDAAVKATCLKTGLTEGKHCSVCKVITKPQEVTPIAGHTEISIPAVAATCTENGLTEGKKCSVCGEITKAQTTVAATGHKETTLAAVASTCTKTGLTEGKKCSVCGTVTVAQTTVALKSHTYGSWVNDETNHWKTCSVCGNVANKAAHTWGVATYTSTTAKSTCSVCSETKTENLTTSHSSWINLGDGEDYKFHGNNIVSFNKESYGTGLYNQLSTDFLLYNTKYTGNYTMTYNFYGTRTSNLGTSDVVTTYAVVWYQDVNNYLVANVLWNGADGNRCAYQIRNIMLCGFINGTYSETHVVWGDNGPGASFHMLPGLSGGYTMKVVKNSNTFTITVIGGGKTITGSATPTLTSGAFYVGVHGANDTFTIKNFSMSGTTASSSISVNGLNKIVTSATGSMKIIAPYKGTSSTNVTANVAFGVKFWWDGNNYLEVYVQWKSGDRPHEIYGLQITGTINGSDIGWSDKWCDGNGRLPAGGGTITVELTATGASISIVSGSYSNSHTRTISGIPTGAYSVEFFSWGNVFTVDKYMIGR